MSEQRSRPAPPRARPLAEFALDGLLDRVGELSRAWAVALITARPPEAIGGVALEELAREAPALISAVVSALRSDEELWELLEGGPAGELPASRLGALAGAAGPRAVIEAVELLRGVVWDASLAQFAYLAAEPARGRSLADLADRLAAVCAALVPVALGGLAAPRPVPEAPMPARAPAEGPGDGTPRPGVVARVGAVIVDEQAEGESRPAQEPSRVPPSEPDTEEPAFAAEIQIRDERGDEGPAAWTRSIGRQLEKYEQDGASFAVLLVELRGELEGSWGPVEELMSDELGTGTMTRERAGRYWLLAPATDRMGAAALASRLGRALERLVHSRGMDLSPAVGTAVCPEDGLRASALAAHADVGLYAARSEHHQTDPVTLARASEE